MRWLLSWALYWAGDAVSKPMLAYDWDWLYQPYNALMTWSVDIQGNGRGPWEKINEIH